MFLDVAPPLPRSAQRLGLTVESHDSGARPLPDGATRWANQQSSRLPHKLLRFDGVPEPEGPASLEGSVDGGPGVAREGVDEVGGIVAIVSASDP
jgi:hypothetical protein